MIFSDLWAAIANISMILLKVSAFSSVASFCVISKQNVKLNVKLKAGLNHVYTKIGIGLLAVFINYQNLSISEENEKQGSG